MSEARDMAHDRARYAYEGRTNYGLVRAENGGIRMDEAHHSKGWEMGFHDGWDAAKADLPDRETVARTLFSVTKHDDEPYFDWYVRRNSFAALGDDYARADAVLALFRGEEPK